MSRYIKDTPRMMVKFVRESDSEIVLQVPATALEIHDYFKIDFIHSVMRNTFGEEKMKKIGNVIVLIDQTYLYQAS